MFAGFSYRCVCARTLVQTVCFVGGGYLQSTSRASQCQSGVLARVSRLKFEVELNYCCWFVNPRTRAVTSPEHSLALGDIYLNTRVISASHISHGITAPGNGCTEIKSTYTSVFEVFLHENILYYIKSALMKMMFT